MPMLRQMEIINEVAVALYLFHVLYTFQVLGRKEQYTRGKVLNERIDDVEINGAIKILKTSGGGGWKSNGGTDVAFAGAIERRCCNFSTFSFVGESTARDIIHLMRRSPCTES